VERFEELGFDENTTTKESRIGGIQIDPKTPSWVKSEIIVTSLNDNSSLLQLTGATSSTFYDMLNLGINNPSSSNKLPTEEAPDNKYLFTSLYIGQGKDLLTINRQTYSLLDWFGDWGGLLDGLRLVAQVLVSPISSLAL